MQHLASRSSLVSACSMVFLYGIELLACKIAAFIHHGTGVQALIGNTTHLSSKEDGLL